jgi:hypothetical protein
MTESEFEVETVDRTEIPLRGANEKFYNLALALSKLQDTQVLKIKAEGTARHSIGESVRRYCKKMGFDCQVLRRPHFVYLVKIKQRVQRNNGRR